MIVGHRRRGWTPRRRHSTAYTARHPVEDFLRMVISVAVLTVGMWTLHAGPAYAQSVLVSSKSVSAPAGFAGVCSRYAWACGRVHSAERDLTDDQIMALSDAVNRSVNRQVREISDRRQYRKREFWALPTRRGGDCEDFALLKKRELIRRGVAADRLLIATVLDRRRQPHAVLVLRTGQGDYVLDNLTSRMLTWDRTGYSFLRMQDPAAKGQWVMVLKGGIFRT